MANSAPQGISASIQESAQNVNPKILAEISEPENLSQNVRAKICELRIVSPEMWSLDMPNCEPKTAQIGNPKIASPKM